MATLGLGSRIRGCIEVGIGIGIGTGNCIGIGNGYRVRYLGQSVWREKGRQCEEMSRSKATDDAATSLSGHPENKSNYPFFALLVTRYIFISSPVGGTTAREWSRGSFAF